MVIHQMYIYLCNLHVTGVKNKTLELWERIIQVMNDIVSTMFNRRFIEEIFQKHQPIHSRRVMLTFQYKTLSSLCALLKGLMRKYDTSGAEDDVRQAGPCLHNAAERKQHGQALWPDDHGGEIPGGTFWPQEEEEVCRCSCVTTLATWSRWLWTTSTPSLVTSPPPPSRWPSTSLSCGLARCSSRPTWSSRSSTQWTTMLACTLLNYSQ